MTILSGNQPCYLPYLGLFNRIAHSDIYMHCGHLKYQRGEWHNSNIIATTKLTVPAHEAFGDLISQVVIDNTQQWKRKHVRSIEVAYRKAKYFDLYFPTLKQEIEKERTFLVSLNIALTNQIAAWLGIKTGMVDGAQWHFEGDHIDKNIAMCRAVKADTYLQSSNAQSARGGPMTPEDVSRMKEAGIEIRWQGFTDPIYGQSRRNGGRLAAIDLLMLQGPDNSAEIVRNCWRPLI